jgi:hypothetical protein
LSVQAKGAEPTDFNVISWFYRFHKGYLDRQLFGFGRSGKESFLVKMSSFVENPLAERIGKLPVNNIRK